MKYIILGIGYDHPTKSKRSLTVELEFASTKPANEKVRNAVVATAFILAFVAVSLFIHHRQTAPQQQSHLAIPTSTYLGGL